jgi:hypothetical protein
MFLRRRERMKRTNIGDIAAIAAAAALFVMAAMALREGQAATYEVNTGLFCAFFCLIPLALRRAGIMSLPSPFVIMIELAIFLHTYGVMFGTYDLLVWWDTVTHFISSVTVALCVFYALLVVTTFDKKINVTAKWMPLLIFLTVLTFGAYWEVFEYFVDVLAGTNMQYSPWDTMRDLTCDVAGALLVSLYAYAYMKKHDGTEFIESLELHPRVIRVVRRE